MTVQDLLPEPVSFAMELLIRSDEPDKVQEGYSRLKALADGGDMAAAACLGYAYQFDHFDFYDLDACREYLQKAVEAENIIGQYYLGMMLYMGEKPFAEDKVYGKWLLDQARNAGLKDANIFWDNIYRKLTPKEARKMVRKARLVLFWEAIKKPFRRRADDE